MKMNNTTDETESDSVVDSCDEQEEEEECTWKKPMELFAEKEMVKICAPMVRYSKLPFRLLVRKYGVDLTYTPMIVSKSFLCSLKARDSDFTTCKGDRPLIVQFAANCAKEYADAAEIVLPYADGVDLNCGCPQRWAQAEGYGAYLLKKPELVHDIIHQTKNRVEGEDFTVSVKIRLHHNLRQTVDFCQKMEHAGASWLTVHGRTPEQRGEPVNLEGIELIKSSVGVPVIANGDVRTLEGAQKTYETTNVDGVMSARGILANPAMFAGYQNTPEQCVKDWIMKWPINRDRLAAEINHQLYARITTKISLALSTGTSFQCFHHHLTFMLQKVMSRAEQTVFSSLVSTSAVLQFLEDNYDISVAPNRH